VAATSPVKAFLKKRIEERTERAPILRRRLIKMLASSDHLKGIQCWRYRHVQAFVHGLTRFDAPFITMITGLEWQLSVATENWGDTPIGKDRVLGFAYADILTGLRTLLNSDLGRNLDMGELDGYLFELAKIYELEIE
jgi:hypothetical protein